MPYIRGKLKGELTAPELRRLIKQHNKLMSITIPTGTKRDGLLKLISDNGYKVNHAGKKLEPSVQMKRKPVVKLPPPVQRKKKSQEDKDLDKEIKELMLVSDRLERQKKKKAPKGFHYMPDGKLMKDSDMKKKEKPKKEFKLKSPRKVGEVAKPTKKPAGFDMKITFKSGDLENQVRNTTKGFLKIANENNVKSFLEKVRRSLGTLNLNEKDRRELVDIAKSVIKLNRPKLSSLVD